VALRAAQLSVLNTLLCRKRGTAREVLSHSLEDDMGERIVNMFGEGVGRILAFLPNLVSAIVILAVGYLISRLLAAITYRVFERLQFDRFVSRRVHQRLGETRSPTGTLRSLVYWIGLLVTFSLTARALGLNSLAIGINRILAFIPQVVVAGIIVLIGVGIANFVGRLLLDSHIWVQRGAKGAILIFASFMALDELGIARGIVTSTFVTLLAAFAIALAIAFGVGNIRLAGEYTRRRVERGERARSLSEPEERPYEPQPH
jgi:hypothetical protein